MSLKLFFRKLYKEFSDKGHFTLEDMGTKEFPEILEITGLLKQKSLLNE